MVIMRGRLVYALPSVRNNGHNCDYYNCDCDDDCDCNNNHNCTKSNDSQLKSRTHEK